MTEKSPNAFVFLSQETAGTLPVTLEAQLSSRRTPKNESTNVEEDSAFVFLSQETAGALPVMNEQELCVPVDWPRRRGRAPGR